MKLVVFTLFVLLCVLVHHSALANYDDEYDEALDDEFVMSDTGEVLGHGQMGKAPSSMSVTFTNTLSDDTLQLYWVSETGENVFIADIPPSTSIPVTTFPSHLFTAKPMLSHATIIPKIVRFLLSM